ACERQAPALPGGARGRHPASRDRLLPARQPGRPDLPARAAAGRFVRGRQRGGRGRGGRGLTGSDVQVMAERPPPGTPRPYDFPAVERFTLPNGIRVVVADLPGRPLVSASLVLRNGAAHEPPAHAGATVLAARAMTEGTARYEAIALVEAAERLGASLHADAGCDATSGSVDVRATRAREPAGGGGRAPRTPPGPARLEAALELLAEVALHPTFPEAEVERLRDERLNDPLQARAAPRRRADEAYSSTIYEGASPYHRPAGGTKETVAELTP